MKAQAILGMAAVAAGLSACATIGKDVPSMSEMLREQTGQNGRACMDAFDFDAGSDGYGVLDNNVVSLEGDGKYYLATVLPGCQDLATSMRILLTGDFNQICGRSFDTVITEDDYCTINQMFEFENRKEAFSTYHKVMEKREDLQKMD